MVQDIFSKKPLDEGKNWLQIVAILLGSLPALCTGLFYAWPSPFITKISNDKINYDITEKEASYFTVLPHLMSILFCPMFSKLSDIIGRKQTIILVSIPYIAAFTLKAFAKSVYTFYLARCIAGIGDGVVFTAIPMYLGEISIPTIRGTWGNAFVLFIIAGTFFMNILGIYFSVAEVSYICLLVPITFVILFPMMPESPFFYLMKGKEKEAKNALKRLRCKKNIENDFTLLKNDVKRQMSESGTWKDLFMIKSNRKALIAGVFARTSQQLSGISAFAMYTKFIFDKSGSNIDSNMSTLIYTGLNCVMVLIGTFTVDRLGRKKSYIFSMAFCAISLAGVSVYLYIDQLVPEIDIRFLQWIPLAGMMWFIVFSSVGILIIPSLIVSELFSASIKAKGLTATVIVLAFFTSLSSYLFYFLHSNFGFYSPFLFFAVCNLVSSFLAMFIIPETSGKTLEEIQQALKK